MATLRDIRRRIRSVKKTQQITSAMRMVAAAKLRRAQDAILAARPYAQRMYSTLAEIGRRDQEATHPLIVRRDSRANLEVLVITSDRGLCGAFNANTLKHADAVIREHSQGYAKVTVSAVGRKAHEHFRRRRGLVESWTDIGAVQYPLAAKIAESIGRRFLAGENDGVVIVYNRFLSAISQQPRDLPLLPFTGSPDLVDTAPAPPFEMEPDPKALLDALVPNALEFLIFTALLDSQAGFYAAQMTAMESATRNTADLISSLTLQFNRARQAAITKELVEIVSGAEALK
jgi:F-type H+-transporting ATPase subunit gamma